MGCGGAGSPGDEGHLVGADDSVLFGKATKKGGDSTPSSHVV